MWHIAGEHNGISVLETGEGLSRHTSHPSAGQPAYSSSLWRSRAFEWMERMWEGGYKGEICRKFQALFFLSLCVGLSMYVGVCVMYNCMCECMEGQRTM